MVPTKLLRCYETYNIAIVNLNFGIFVIAFLVSWKRVEALL